MFDASANYRTLLDDTRLDSKVAAAREIVQELLPPAPRTEEQLSADVSAIGKQASAVNAEIQQRLRAAEELHHVKVACAVHIARVCQQLAPEG